MQDQRTPGQVADAIDELARDSRFAGRATDLGDLSSDLRDPDGQRFVGLDLSTLFPASSVLRVRGRGWAELFFGTLAAIVVFAPVAWTWWGFHKASEAFRDLVAEEGEPEGVTFLSLWAGGFDGRLSPRWTLVNTGLWSFLLILIAVSLVVLHRLAVAIAESAEDRAVEKAVTELASALTQAQVVLNARRAQHPQRIEEVFESSLRKLDEAHSRSANVVARLEEVGSKVLDGLEQLVAASSAASAQAGGLLTEVGEAATRFGAGAREASGAVAESISALEGAVSTGVGETNKLVADTARSLDEGVRASLEHSRQSLAGITAETGRGLRESLDDFGRDMGERLAGFTEQAVGEVARAGAGLHGVMEAIDASARSSNEGAARLTEQVTRMTDDNAAARDEMLGSLVSVREILAELESVLDRNERALQAQTTELTSARDSSTRLLHRLSLAAAGGDA